jgi:phosphohistidine phosphatase
MYLLFIRHAIAAQLGGQVTRNEARDEARDENRPLTTQGERRFRLVARALVRLLPRPKAILTSPLLRARQTAELAAEAWGNPTPVVVPALLDGDWPGIRRTLADYGDQDAVALIGHEDWMSALTARLLGSKSRKAFGYRKGGVALIELDNPETCRGTLHWFIPPRVFRKLC